MNGKIKIVLIILSLLSLAFVSGVEAAITNTQTNQGNINTTGSPNQIYLGKMKIIDGVSTIKLEHDNLITIDGGSQEEMYIFIIDYVFKENSINQEKWVFKIEISGEISNSPKTSEEVIFLDNWWNEDEGSGELWLEVSGYDLWTLNNNYITVRCEQWMDILWLGNFGLVDSAEEIILVKTQNFPAPVLTWSAPDGDTWQIRKLGDQTEPKRFIITNTGEWKSKGIEINLVGSSDFSIIEGETTISLDPEESHELTVSFKPASKGTKTAKLTAVNNDEWYCESSNMTITGRVGRSRSRILNYFGIFSLIEKMPILQKILQKLL